MTEKKSTRKNFIATALLAGACIHTLAVSNEDELLSAATQPLIFLFQGDSITDGNRGRNADPNHIMGHGYAFSIASRIGADFPASGFSFYNRGVSGNSVADLQQRWQEDAVNLHPDILSILVGINDVNAVVEDRPRARSADAFEAIYRQLLEDAQANSPKILFVLGLPFVYPVGKRKEKWDSWKSETAERANRVKKLAKEFNAVLVDYPLVFDKAITKAPVDYWIWDGIHPTVPAHELMARAWIHSVSSRLAFLKKYNADK